jgi:hypothetical protein
MRKRTFEPVEPKPDDEPVLNHTFAHHTVATWVELHPTGTIQELLEYLNKEADKAVEDYVRAYADRYPPHEVARTEAFAREYVRRLLDFRRRGHGRVSGAGKPS